MKYIYSVKLVSVVFFIFFLFYAVLFCVALNREIEIKDMDWDNDGHVSPMEIIDSTDIGTRKELINGQECKEFYSLKDGLPVKNVCEFNSMEKE